MKVFMIFMALLFLGTGCATAAEKDEATNSSETNQDLQFENQDLHKLFTAIRSDLEKRTKGWKHIPWGKGGNFYYASWATGSGARDGCVIASVSANRADQHCVELYTLFYSQTFPKVFGLGVRALRRPKDKGWGAAVYLSVEGKTIVGEGFHLTLKKYENATGGAAVTLHLGSTLEYTVGATNVRIESPHLPLRDVNRFLSSASALKEAAFEDFVKLEQKVEDTLKKHEAQAMEYGPYEGNGIPPVKIPRPLTEQEEKEELAKAKAYFTKQRQLIAKEHTALYEAATKTLIFYELLM